MTPVREALEALRHADIDMSMLLSEIANDEMRASVRKTLGMIDRARKALSAAPGEPCAVKPLKWRDHRPDSFPEPAWSAQTPFGFYNIEEVCASDSPAYVVRLHAHHFIADKDGLDEAKDAAQADYEQRIRSALVTTPQPAAGWDEAIEAAAKWHESEAAHAKVIYSEMDRYSDDHEERAGWRSYKDKEDRHLAYAAHIRSLRREAPAPAEGVVERVLSELRDRRLLNDVDDDLHREIAIALIKAAEPILAPAECNCDDPDCPKRHWSLTLRQAYENAIARLREAEAGLRSWEITAKRISEEETRQSTCDQCPKCGGDCSAANPPVYDCPMVGCNKDF